MLLVLSLLTGCASFQAKPLLPAETGAAFESRTLDDPSLIRFLEINLQHDMQPWPPRSWNLELLTQAAFYYHPDLDVARARWAVAEAGVITAGHRPNPSVAFSPIYVSNAAGSVFPWVLGLNFDIPIETAGKRGYRIAQARQLSAAAQFNIAMVAWQVHSRVRASLLSLLAAERAVVIVQRRLELDETIVQLVEQRLTFGEISQHEVTQARIALNQDRLTLQDLQKQRAEARGQLAAAVGLPVSALEQVAMMFDPLEQAPNGKALSDREVRRAALTNRPDLLGALADYEAMQTALQLEIAKQYPDFHLGTGYSWELGEKRWWLPSLNLALPVFNQNQGPIAEAEARRQEAAARFTALQAQVAAETDRALASTLAALNKLATAEALLAAQDQQQQVAQSLFKAGETDRLAVASAQLEYETAALARLNAHIQAQQALGLLEDAVQRPLDQSEVPPFSLETNPRG
ncbi:MAG: TolC family protein [Deltaproteobacteria bacterium]|nr:TolC family protein [Deltaproteobacteria bacterium]